MITAAEFKERVKNSNNEVIENDFNSLVEIVEIELEGSMSLEFSVGVEGFHTQSVIMLVHKLVENGFSVSRSRNSQSITVSTN